MKKLLTLALAAMLAAGCAQTALADDGASSIMAQIQSFKTANNEKTGEAAPEEQKTEAPAQAEETQAPAAQQPEQENPAAAAMEQIRREEAAKAAQELNVSDNNSGVVEAPAPVQTQEQAPAPAAPARVQTVQIPSTEAQPEPAAPTAAPTVQIPTVEETQPAAAQPAAPTTPAPALSAGRPLNPSPMQPGEPETAESALVSVDWLKANLGSVVLVDSRPESLYLGGHIPGAVNAPWTYFANMNAKQGTDKWGTIWPEATMAKRIGALGIDGKKTVVAYCDAGGWGQSGWTLWILRQAGIKNAKILTGGIGAWKEAGGKLDKTKVKPKTVAFSIKQYVPNYTATTEWINDNLGKPGLAVIDVRTLPEYNGKIRPFQEKRAGHLPGAIHIPRDNFVTEKGHFKAAGDVVSMLAQYGVTPETEIVVYDTAGVRSAFVTMLLRYAGFHKSQSYDAGFQAWAGNPDLPIVTQ